MPIKLNVGNLPDITDEIPDPNEILEDAKDAIDDSVGDVKLKWTFMVAAVKDKMSCCFGGEEKRKLTAFL